MNKIFIAQCFNLLGEMINLIILSETHPEISILLSLVSLAITAAVAVAVAIAGAVAGVVAGAAAGVVAVAVAVVVAIAGVVAGAAAVAGEEEEQPKPKRIKRCSKCKQEIEQ